LNGFGNLERLTKTIIGAWVISHLESFVMAAFSVEDALLKAVAELLPVG